MRRGGLREAAAENSGVYVYFYLDIKLQTGLKQREALASLWFAVSYVRRRRAASR